jgi:hypothetical protein
MRMSADLIWRLRICMHMRVLLATLLNDSMNVCAYGNSLA